MANDEGAYYDLLLRQTVALYFFRIKKNDREHSDGTARRFPFLWRRLEYLLGGLQKEKQRGRERERERWERRKILVASFVYHRVA